MKKTSLFIVLAFTLIGSSFHAQDTLWMKPAPLGSYFNNNWIDTTIEYYASNTRIGLSHALARQFVAQNEVLEVYGIAAMMINIDSFYFMPTSAYPNVQSYLAWAYPDNPGLYNCEESLLLFQYHSSPTPTMLQQGDSLRVHILDTPVSYWIMSNTSPVSFLDTMRKPVYERYFSTPQTVQDTFYVGFTITDGGFSKIDSVWRRTRPDFSCYCFRNRGTQLSYEEDVAAYRQTAHDAPHEWEFFHGFMNCSYFIFPIIAPPDTTVNPGDTIVNPNDTTVNPDDTITPGVGLRQTDMLYRYTAVQPNPATQRATVTSSFGLTQIDVYDTKGRLLHSLPATGLKADLDISSWPRGTYLLRILTPAGPTTKKLLVQ